MKKRIYFNKLSNCKKIKLILKFISKSQKSAKDLPMVFFIKQRILAVESRSRDENSRDWINKGSALEWAKDVLIEFNGIVK